MGNSAWSHEPGHRRVFLNGQFRLKRTKLGKTNNFPLCCQLRLRTATEWVSYVSCAMLTLGSACRINLRDCSAGGWPGQLYSQYYLAESVPLPGETIMKKLNGIPAVSVPWTILLASHLKLKKLTNYTFSHTGRRIWREMFRLLLHLRLLLTSRRRHYQTTFPCVKTSKQAR